MIVLINAISIKEGGSLVVLQNLLRQFVRLRPDIDWHVAANERIREIPELSLPNVTAHVFPGVDRTSLHLKWWYNRTLPKLLGDLKADVLFSQTNYLSDGQVDCPTLLLEQHAGHFSPVFDALMQESLSMRGRWAWKAKKRWVVKSLRQSTRITVQTEALAEAIAAETGLPRRKIAVIPHGPGLAGGIHQARPFPGKGILHLGYVSKHGVQKNFAVLFKAVSLLSRQGIAVQLHLTLGLHLGETAQVMALAHKLGVDNVLVNHGDLDADGVCKLYANLDLFIFPSLCESFGFPLLEAMSFGLPLLVADTKSNLEIVGTADYRFSANDADDLATKMLKLTGNQREYETAAQYFLHRAQRFQWDAAARRTLGLLTDLAAMKGRE